MSSGLWIFSRLRFDCSRGALGRRRVRLAPDLSRIPPACGRFFFNSACGSACWCTRGPPACRACPLARGPTGRERDRRAGTLPATFRAWRESRYASKPVVSQMQRITGSGPSGLIVMGPELAAARKLKPKSAGRSSPPQARIPCPSTTTIKRAESP